MEDAAKVFANLARLDKEGIAGQWFIENLLLLAPHMEAHDQAEILAIILKRRSQVSQFMPAIASAFITFVNQSEDIRRGPLLLRGVNICSRHMDEIQCCDFLKAILMHCDELHNDFPALLYELTKGQMEKLVCDQGATPAPPRKAVKLCSNSLQIAEQTVAAQLQRALQEQHQAANLYADKLVRACHNCADEGLAVQGALLKALMSHQEIRRRWETSRQSPN